MSEITFDVTYIASITHPPIHEGGCVIMFNYYNVLYTKDDKSPCNNKYYTKLQTQSLNIIYLTYHNISRMILVRKKVLQLLEVI